MPALPLGFVATATRRLNPAILFAALSLLFGAILVAVTPPLRGPDETAHFVRAYGIAEGDIIPAMRDADGHKGIMMPPGLFAGFNHFEQARVSEKKPGFSYGQVLSSYFAGADTTLDTRETDAPAFVRYEGSEGYSPAAYLPQVAAALVARAAGLDFLSTLALMRLAGLIVMTGVICAAIRLAGPLGWAFFAIAMLPAAVYGRAVVNADGAAVAFAMLAAALFLRPLRNAGIPTRVATMLLCVLSKPANLALVLLEALRPERMTPRSRLALGLMIVLPAAAAALLWTWASGADAASWRLADLTGTDPQEFDPGWKLRFMLANPLDFPHALLGWFQSKDMGEFGRQIVGVLGLFDTVLQSWVYPLVAALTAVTFAVRLGLPRMDRYRLAAGAAITTLAYCFTVFLIFYLIWTPVEASEIWGVQGRYLVPILPLVGIVAAALIDRAPDPRITAFSAIAVALISGVASIEAILRTDWNF